MSSQSLSLERYRTRIREASEIEGQSAQRLSRLSNLRLAAAGISAASIMAWLITGSIEFLAPASVTFALFLLLVFRHRAESKRHLRATIAREYNEESVSRVLRDWDAIPLHDAGDIDPDHPYAGDLDIVGHGSLLQLLDTVSTKIGEERLRSWLLTPAAPEVVADRQPAVLELAHLPDWREELVIRGRFHGTERPHPSEFLDWAESEPGLAGKPWLVWVARAGMVATLAFVAAAVAGFIPPAIVIIPFLANLAFSFACRTIVGERIEAARSEHAAIQSYHGLLEQIESGAFKSSCLQDIQQRVSSGTRPAHREIERLDRISSWAVPKGSLAYLPVQALANWDIQLLDALERWQIANGRQVRQWLDNEATVEALCALAQLSFDNPAWTFAHIDESANSVEGARIGHPLLPERERITNTVTVGPPGSVLLVTGSNMSGKSTLLRSIGIDIVLAQAGGPTCAETFSMPPIDLWTSVRISDSLERGISLYMAELLRLRQIHGAAEKAVGEDRTLLYLLDEILHGTNSVERQLAARHVVGELVNYGAIGAVSTHDLRLAADGALADAAIPVHFTDGVAEGDDGPTMQFDYLLKDGIATSTNALRLMEMVGFELNGRDQTIPDPESYSDASRSR